MASLGHVAVAMAAGRALGPAGVATWKVTVAFVIVSLAPDLDAIGFLFGVRYADPFGHRGASHSLLLAPCVGILAWLFAPRRARRGRTAGLATLVAASHGILDTMTFGGGLGCALFWPLSNARFWSPARFIPVAPIGLQLL